MELIEKKLMCAKETLELGEGIVALVGAIKVALEDGWQAGEDLTAILSFAMSNLGEAVKGMDQIPEELKSPEEFANAIYVSLSKLPLLFMKK